MSHPRKVARFIEWSKNMVAQATVGDHESNRATKGRKRSRKPRRKRIRKRMRRPAD